MSPEVRTILQRSGWRSAARAWSLVQTARIFQVSPLTIASWMTRLDQEGPVALVPLSEPVNRFPEFVAYLVRAAPQVLVRGKPGARLNLSVHFLTERRHLPVITLKREA